MDRTKILKGFKKDKVIKDYFFIEKNLENFLLENIKNQSSNYETYLECFSKYEECIKKALSVKSKFYAFFEAYFLQQGYSKKELDEKMKKEIMIKESVEIIFSKQSRTKKMKELLNFLKKYSKRLKKVI